MMEKQKSVQQKMEAFLERTPPVPLLLHSCCAPCSSHCMEVLCKAVHLTVFYYNPNISPDAEYEKRLAEEHRLIGRYNEEIAQGIRTGYPIRIRDGAYEPERFFELAKGLEMCPERGERCFRCYELRLRETARMAALEGYACFATTLTLSPLKDAAKLNEIGERLGEEYGVPYLATDFKKKGGYQRSLELSRQYGLYRQDFCGCVYSKAQREKEKAEKLR